MSSKASGRVRRDRSDWARILRQFETSGLSGQEFCRRQKLSLSSFQRWRSRLKSAEVAKFVELVPAEQTPATASAWSLEIALPNGVELRFRG